MSALPAADRDVIEIGDQFYIRAQSSLADKRTRVLLNGDTFAVSTSMAISSPTGPPNKGCSIEIHVTCRN